MHVCVVRCLLCVMCYSQRAVIFVGRGLMCVRWCVLVVVLRLSGVGCVVFSCVIDARCLLTVVCCLCVLFAGCCLSLCVARCVLLVVGWCS